MTAAAALSPNFYSKRSTDELIAARDLVEDILDFRARQFSLFEPPVSSDTKPGPVLVDTKVDTPPAPSAITQVLTPSAVNCFSQCEAKWFYRKVLHLPEMRTAALGLGSAVHATLAANFREKCETFEDLPFEGLRPVFLDAFAQEFESVTLSPDDDTSDLLSCGETLLRVYLDRAAPSIQPAAVELPVQGEIGGVKVRGYVDLLDVDGNIIDIKTAGKNPGRFPGDHRVQVSTYAMITPGASGRARLDTLTKTKTVSLYSHTIDVGEADRKHAERLYSITLDQMNSGLYKPNRSSNLCSRKYCGFADKCEADFGGCVA